MYFKRFFRKDVVGKENSRDLPRFSKSLVCLLCILVGVAFGQTFTKVTTGPVVNDGGNSHGGSWGDFNGDGYLDLFVPNHQQNNFLYQNNGDGTFTKITSGDIVNDGGSSYAGTWGDYDNDGDLDLFVANLENQNNFLYQNNGDGTFSKITHGAIVTDGGDSRDASWGDYDNDGYLDLVVVNGFDANNFLYHNNGDGTFTKITNSPIVLDGGNSTGCNWGDYDNDGYIDLFVANFTSNQNNFLYHNNGDGTFTKITTGAIVNDGGESQGATWGDFNNDGYLDLFVPNKSQNNFLYQNNGDGTFTKITNSVITTDGGNSACSTWGDFDNDGDLDLYVTNRSPEANFYYLNNGDGTFTKNTTSIIVQDHLWSLGTTSGDYDNDGDLDIFVANWSNANNFLFTNNGNTNHWVNCRLVGSSFSNISAIGSRISLEANIQGIALRQTREVSGQTGNNAQNSLNAEFGLGDATIIDSIIVEWPGADTTTVLTNVAVNQFLTITEPLVPLLRSVFPDSGYQGYPVSVIISAKNTHFDLGNGVLDVRLEQGASVIHATTFSASSATVVHADFDIPATAPIGLWDVVVESDADGVVTLSNAFQILLSPPLVGVNPDSIREEVFILDSVDVTVLISNLAASGSGDLLWSASVSSAPPSPVKPRSPVPPSAATAENFPRGSYPPSFGAPPVTEAPAIRSLHQESRVTTPGSAWSIEQSNGFITGFNLAQPEVLPYIAPDPSFDFDNAGDFPVGDQSFFYLLDSPGNFYTVDTTSGSATNLGFIPPVGGGQSWTGMATDPTDGTIYAVSCDIITSNLYLIDPTVPSATLIGAVGSPCIIGIAIDGEGELFGYDIVNDNFLRIDKQTGLGTPIGPIGFDANFGQGLGWDAATDELYMAAFNNATFQPELRLVDKTTGNTTFLGVLGASVPGGLNQLAFLAIPGSAVNFVQLVGNTSGLIGPGDSDQLTVRLYGLEIPDTSYFATLRIHTNDPFTPEVDIPIRVDAKDTMVAINPPGNLPRTFAVSRNYPNPFNPSTTIRYQLPRGSEVVLEIYNILGEKVRSLVNQRQEAGYHKVVWDGRDDNGVPVASGLYLYRFRAGKYEKTNKMVLLK